MDIDLAALRGLERERDISVDIIIPAIEQAMLVAYHRADGARRPTRVELARKPGPAVLWARDGGVSAPASGAARGPRPAGLPSRDLERLVSAGKLERVARGVYSLPNQAIRENRSLAEVAIQVPRGVICLVSALRVHDIGTQAPHEVWLALGHKTWSPRADKVGLRIVRLSGPALHEGIETHTVEGVTLRVYVPAKTVAACFKFRHTIGLDVARGALSETERRAVLGREADVRGVSLSDEVMGFMLTRFSLDLGSLMQLLDQLDAYALQTQRAITIPLIRSLLASHLPSLKRLSSRMSDCSP